jgi:hypothetical protein
LRFAEYLLGIIGAILSFPPIAVTIGATCVVQALGVDRTEPTQLHSTSPSLRLAEERLKESGAKCYVSPGNDATFAIDPIIQLSDYVIYPEGKVVVIDDQHEMTGRGSKALSRSAEPFA